MVYVSAVMNYAAQSEMNIYLLRAIRHLVETKEYTEIDNAIKVVNYSKLSCCVPTANLGSHNINDQLVLCPGHLGVPTVPACP